MRRKNMKFCTRKKEPYEVLSTAWLSYEDILKLKMVESMVEVYYNSGQFRKTLSLDRDVLSGDVFLL